MADIFQSSHNLLFESAGWDFDREWTMFTVGTCHGLYKCSKYGYEILVIGNDVPGNGHFDDVMEWFENSCKRDGFDLIIREFFNSRFKQHLINKRGFSPLGQFDLIKNFKSKNNDNKPE